LFLLGKLGGIVGAAQQVIDSKDRENALKTG
jgi:hypothetical protein